MSKKCSCIARSVVGLGYLACGISKLAGLRSQKERFFDWGWKAKDMKLIGVAETTGALLLAAKPTRKIGCVILGATSLCMVISGLLHGDKATALPHAGGFIATLCIFFRKKHRKEKVA